MQNSICELLVHIAAPSTLKDDQRFSDIAQSILEFHAVTRFGSSWNSDSSLSTPFSADATKQPPSGAEETSSFRMAHGQSGKSIPLTESVAATQLLRTTPSSWLLSSSLSGLDVETSRPKTAPELNCIRAEPPVAVSVRKHQRSYSDTSSLSHSISAIPNSYGQEQGMTHTSDCTSNNSRLYGELSFCRVPSTPTRERPPSKRRRVGAGLTYETPRESLSTASIMNARVLSSLPDSMELTKSFQSVSSTLSPSQPIQLRVTTPARMLPNEEKSNEVLFMDLTKGTPEQISKEVDRPQLTHWWCEEDRHDNVANDHSNKRPDSGDKVFADEVASPPSRGGEHVFTTHITRTLQTIVDRIPLDKVFRPSRISRPVRALERGRWLLNILVVRDQQVSSSRCPVGNDEKLGALDGEFDIGRRKVRWTQDDGPGRRHSAWTEVEFLNFWRNMSRLVRQGKCGMGCRLVKEVDREASSELGQVWRITMFCWGEVVAHIWLALWILSDKLTAQTPMQWISGDGTVVIEMSGEKVSRTRTNRPEMAPKG
ncbi:hypothetical protein PV10_03191 [Exophiala mesophila]|uniref:Uncharacterized protein n=1 Tax=Exophiala mesophila TaxID=212818 RepID=A0A0D2A9D5_EXOME|nr:uncharacterized protein PV10_03191 [Exophiala mesophila]KIV95553.1 hypothetical protein PV10_03191 [Exophiala mesophila]